MVHRHTKLYLFHDFIFITHPCSWVHLCILMSPCICIAEKYLPLHFLEAQLVWVDRGALGRIDVSHPPLCFCCALLKEMRPHNRRLSAALLWEPHYHLRELGQVATRDWSSALLAKRDSHSPRKSRRTSCQQMSLGKFLDAHAWEKRSINTCTISCFLWTCLHNPQASYCRLSTSLFTRAFKQPCTHWQLRTHIKITHPVNSRTRAGEWVSDLWIMQCANRRGGVCFAVAF